MTNGATNPTHDTRDDDGWFALAALFGLLSLFCYFFSIVIHVFPWSVGRLLFYGFGPTLAIATFAFGRLLRRLAGARPLFELGVISTVIAGVVVNMMAVIQDSTFTVMRKRIADAELAATKDQLRRVLWGVNNVQISLDIVFDIWIAIGTVFLALGMLAHFRQRLFGAVGAGIGVMALVVNFATLPVPPAEAGLFDPGPFVATWLGLMLALVAWRYRKERQR